MLSGGSFLQRLEALHGDLASPSEPEAQPSRRGEGARPIPRRLTGEGGAIPPPAAGLLRRLEGADPVNSANTGRLDYNMYNLVLNLI